MQRIVSGDRFKHMVQDGERMSHDTDLLQRVLNVEKGIIWILHSVKFGFPLTVCVKLTNYNIKWYTLP